MNILFLHCNADLYGSSRSLLRLATRLVAEGHRVHAILPEHGVLNARLDSVGATVRTQVDLAVLRRPLLSTPSDILALARQIRRGTRAVEMYCREQAIDLIHTNSSIVLAGGGAARRCGIPHIVHVREFYSEFGPLWRFYERYILRGATRVVCVSEGVARQFRDRRKVCVIHNGMPIEEFEPVETAKIDRLRQLLGLSADELVVGLVGRIKLKRKGQEVLIQAAARLREAHPNARFVIAGMPYPGNESHLEAMRTLIRDLRLGDIVLHAGEVEDVRPLYAILDVSVMTSALPEPFGGVVLESMAMGKPVIGTNIGGTPEQIADGETGLLIPPGDPAALAAALDRLLRDPALRQAMGRAARQRFLAHFTFEPFWEKMASLYRELT